jgi:glucuronate isomerase
MAHLVNRLWQSIDKMRGATLNGKMLDPQRRDPDRLLPTDPRVRDIARRLYDVVATAAIVSPHGHVPIEWLADDQPFSDPTDLLISHDHYVTRLLHASGIDLATFVGGGADARATWRLFAENWSLFSGTASGYWLEEEFAEVLRVPEPLTGDSADRVYDHIAGLLTRDEFRPRALFERFGIEVLATTDDPLDDLSAHLAVAASGLPGRVLPTFRPDKYIDPTVPGYTAHVGQLLAASNQPATFPGYLAALAGRREHFIRCGAVSADHGVEEIATADLDPDEAERLFSRALGGRATATEKAVLRGHMLLKMAEMSVDDGLVMTVHAGVLRNHHMGAFRAYGPDRGHDIPVRTDFVRGLRPLLERFGLERDFHLVLFTVDETTFSREIAPLAGFYPSVYIGAPWWFLDAPYAMKRFRQAVTETAGFSRGSGFIDDTRAFLSIPARHDTSRRADAAFLAELVAEGRLSVVEAERIIHDLVVDQPRRVFKL